MGVDGHAVRQVSGSHYLVFLAELLTAEIDARAERRRARRIAEAKFPRRKCVSEFNIDIVPAIQGAELATCLPAPTSGRRA